MIDDADAFVTAFAGPATYTVSGAGTVVLAVVEDGDPWDGIPALLRDSYDCGQVRLGRAWIRSADLPAAPAFGHSLAQEGTVWTVADARPEGAMVGLYKPTEDLTKVLDALGYKSGVDLVKQQGFVGALQTLQGVADRSGFSLGRLFESAEALTGIAGLSAQNWGRFADMLHQVEASTGGTDAAFQRWRQTSQAVKDTYDATMQNLEKNQNNPLGMLQNQEAYYTAKSSGSIGLIGDAQVTIDNFWSLFNAAMQQTMPPRPMRRRPTCLSAPATTRSLTPGFPTPTRPLPARWRWPAMPAQPWGRPPLARAAARPGKTTSTPPPGWYAAQTQRPIRHRLKSQSPMVTENWIAGSLARPIQR